MALYAYQGIQKSTADLADEACRIELDVLEKPIGKQDQYATAIGGMNLIEFKQDGTVACEPVVAPEEHMAALHRSLLLFYTGSARQTGDAILENQSRAASSGENTDAMREMKELAYAMRDQIHSGDIEAVGRLLDRNWQLKREAAPGTTTKAIDDLYNRALDAGAWGGKLLGAGGGGFFVVVASSESQAQVRRALGDYREIPFRFASRGSHLLLVEHD